MCRVGLRRRLVVQACALDVVVSTDREQNWMKPQLVSSSRRFVLHFSHFGLLAIGLEPPPLGLSQHL